MDEEKKKEIAELIQKEKATTDLFAAPDQNVVKVEKRASEEATEIIGEIHKAAIVDQVKTNEEIKGKFITQAQKTVENELESIDQENIARRQKTTYDANREACRNYGVDEAVPLWQIRLMRFGSGVWFVIYFIFASLTIAPINVFFKGIKSFIKNSYIVFAFALLCYLLIVVGIPLVLKFLG